MTLDEIKARLVASRSAHAAVVADASKLVKGVPILIGALFAGAAQFWTWSAGQAPAASQIVGICACVVIFVGGIYVLLTEQDASEAIEIATVAIDAARAAESQFEGMRGFINEYDRLSQTYQICLTLRGYIEQFSLGSVGDLNTVVDGMFDLVSREMAIAIGFDQADRWTLGVYRAVPAKIVGKIDLKCVAHERAIKCQVGEARVWPEGVGIAGIAYTNAREIIVPDLRAEGIAAVFGPRGLVRPYDSDRYVSMAAVPIMVAGQERPWGVINATSDRADHFTADSDFGFKADEPIRALAAFVALAVANWEAAGRATSSGLVGGVGRKSSIAF